MTSSTLVVTTGGMSATGTEQVQTTTSAPPGCSTATIFCPPGYCLYRGFCLPVSSTQTCNYTVTLDRT
jgi:hypothetical protein